jgi:hypothetical protein
VVEISTKPSGMPAVWKLLGPEHAFVYVPLAIGAYDICAVDAPEEHNMANTVDEAASRILGSKTEKDGVD